MIEGVKRCRVWVSAPTGGGGQRRLKNGPDERNPVLQVRIVGPGPSQRGADGKGANETARILADEVYRAVHSQRDTAVGLCDTMCIDDVPANLGKDSSGSLEFSINVRLTVDVKIGALAPDYARLILNLIKDADLGLVEGLSLFKHSRPSTDAGAS